MAKENESLRDGQKFEINCIGEPAVNLRGPQLLSKNKKSIILRKHQERMISEEMSPYVTSQTSAKRLYALKNPTKCSTGMIGDRLMSAKLIRMKGLESELNFRRNQLNEVIGENRLLKALQRRQDHALKKYEGTNGQLPQLIESHTEEIKALKAKCKKITAQNKELERKLHDREMDLQVLQDRHRHLLRLSKDRNLGEREKLREENNTMKQMLQSMDYQLQDLSKKRAIEQKVHQQRLQKEINRSRECRKAQLISEQNLHQLEARLGIDQKNLVTETPAKFTKKTSAPYERLPSIDQHHQLNLDTSVDLNSKQDKEKRSIPHHTFDIKNGVSMKAKTFLHLKKEKKLKQLEPRICEPRICEVTHRIDKNSVENKTEFRGTESAKLSEEFHLSLDNNSSERESKNSDCESQGESLPKSTEGREGTSSNEERCTTDPEKEVTDATPDENSGKTDGLWGCDIIVENSDINATEMKNEEMNPNVDRIESSKKSKLLKALRVIDQEELSETETSEIDSEKSASKNKAMKKKKPVYKSASFSSKGKTIGERSQSDSNSGSSLRTASSLRNMDETDLMHELFGTIPNTKAKILKKKKSDAAVGILEDIKS